MKRALVVLTFFVFAQPLAAAAQEPVPSATPEARERSRTAFKKGVAQLRAQDWASARASFETAWSLFPHPSILLNLGISRLRTGDPVLAESDFVRFLSEDFGASQDELATARDSLSEARGSIGTLRIEVLPASASVTVDGKAVQLSKRGAGLASELHVKAGKHAVATEASGFERDAREVSVEAKAEALVKIDLKAVPASPALATGMSTRHIVGWSVAGLGGAALVTGGVLAIRANGLAADYNDAVRERREATDMRSEGIGYRTGADVALGVAVVCGVAAAILLLTDVGEPKETRSAILTW